MSSINIFSKAVKGGHKVLNLGIKGGAVALGGNLAWENIVNDKSWSDTLMDHAVGEEGRETIKEGAKAVSDMAGKATEGIKDVAEGVKNTIDTVTGVVNGGNGEGSQNGLWGGITNIFGGVMNTFTGFLSNLTSGKVSGMSMAGLAVAAFMIFGSRGWLGKIAGLLLGSMLLRSNSQSQEQGQSQSQQSAVTENEEERVQRKPVTREDVERLTQENMEEEFELDESQNNARGWSRR